jgi:hypothetical protein
LLAIWYVDGDDLQKKFWCHSIIGVGTPNLKHIYSMIIDDRE